MFNREERAFCSLTCDYLTKSVCQSGAIECFENMGVISTVYALWNIKMSKRLSCILLWKYGIFSKHLRLHLKIEWISIHLMTQIKSCIDLRESRFRSSECEFVHDTYLVLFDYRLLHSDGSELDKLLLGAVFLDNMNIVFFSTV